MMSEADDEHVLLHVLKIRGLATEAQIAASLGVTAESVRETLRSAVAVGSARYREGRVSGFALTPEGRVRHQSTRASCVSNDMESCLSDIYERFLAPNRGFKQLTKEWQTREPDADRTPLIAQLDELHDKTMALVRQAATACPRFSAYLPRFERALSAVKSGDATALARPMTDSYHDVWMELHEDLISTLGRQRDHLDE
jgi:hypothetical protein